MSLSSGSGRPRTIVAPCYYNILTGHGDKILNFHMDLSHPCAQCITLMLWMKSNYWGYKCESCCCLSFAHQTDMTPKIFSVVAWCSLADMHRHFRVPAARVMEAAGSSQRMLHIYWLTVAGLRWQATSLSSLWEPQISFYMVLNKSLKSWPKSDWYEIVYSYI